MAKPGPKPGTVKRPDRVEAMKGNKFAVGHGFGRPKKWTDDLVEIEAEELIKWSTKETSLYMKRFAFERGYGWELLYDWKESNKIFRQAWQSASANLENRMVSNSLNNKYNAGFAKFILSAKHGFKPDVNTIVTNNYTPTNSTVGYEE